MKRFLHLTVLLLFSIGAFAQNYNDGNQFLTDQDDHQGCGFHPTKEQIYKLENDPAFREQERWFLENYHNRALLPVQSIPIKAHIVRTSAGTNGLTVTQLNDAMTNLNNFYINANMQFYLCDGINYIDDDNYYDYDAADEVALRTAHNVPNLVNIYFCNTVSSGGNALCGYAYFPGGPDLIMMANNCTTNGSTLPHEVGHFFALYHTHGTANGTLTDELVNGSNCAGSGDRVCDTEADPQLGNANVSGGCVYNGTAPYTSGGGLDGNGDPFAPNPQNIMSYSRKTCRTLFTPGQYARMYAAYSTQRNYFTCPSFNVDFSATPTASCSVPQTVNFTDASVGATSWQWDVDGDGTVDYTTQNPTHTYTTSGNYDVRLTVSNGSETIIRTKTSYIQVGAVGTIPYNEDFETFTPANNATGLANGWTTTPSNNTTDFRWNPNQGTTVSNNTGPTVDNTLGTAAGTYMYTEASQGANGDITELISPCIQLNATAPLLEFAYHMFGADIGTLHVDINDGGGWTNDITPAITGQQQAATGDAYQTRQVDLVAYANQIVQIRFRVERGNNFRGDIAIDDINITNNTSAPEISFVNNVQAQTEANTSGAVDCRGYVDLSIPLQIANVPTGDAVVAFSVAGPADAYDYQLLTPTITFPNGSIVNQNLGIRVWDDSNEENNEDLIVSYTILGATNAVAGLSNQSFTLTIQDNDLLPSEAGTSVNTLLNEDFEGGILPAGWARTQQAGSNGWIIDAAANQNSPFITIPGTNTSSIAGSNDDACDCDMSEDYLVTPAVNLNAAYTSAALQLDAYFPGNYGSSAFVKVSTTSDAGPWTTVATLTGDVANWQNGINIDLSAYIGSSNVWVSFHHNDNGAFADGFFVDNVSINATGGDAVVATALNATNEHYFGPNETVYFYDASGNIMARLVNNSAWDYGCTSVTIDRAGTGAMPYDYNNVQYYVAQKTIRIEPTNNSPTGQYDVTLYYSGNEITTWEATSTNTRNNLNILKTGGASSNITPATPQANGNTNYEGTAINRMTYSTSDYMISATFNTGFSGFSIGEPAPPIILENQLVNFDGNKLSDQHNQLIWQVNDLENLGQYILERSTDATYFEAIAEVPALEGQDAYMVDDQDAATRQLCYYRLKMVGTDATHQYSDIIAIAGTNTTVQQFNVFPNPTNGALNIALEVNSDEAIPLMVHNSIGQLVLSTELAPSIGNNRFTIDLSDLPAGVYSIQIQQDGIAYNKTIVRE